MNPHAKELSVSPAILWTCGGFFLLFWLYALGMRSLVPTDEGRYAEMAREMLASGDWITPRLNGIKYFEKPPLQTWMNALTFAVFGLGEWQARLWTGLCALLGIVLTGHTGRVLYGARAGLYAMLILGSCFFWVGLGHINTLDMGLSGMMTLALCSLLLAQRDEASSMERRKWMLVCWAGMALSVLSKGLIGLILPGAVLVLYTLLARDWTIWKRLNLFAGVLLFFVICTPWFVLVSIQNPEFPHFFFIHEHFERFLTKVHQREGSWYYFVPLLVLGMMPWLALLPPSLLAALGQSKAESQAKSQTKSQAKSRPIFRQEWLLVVWIGFIFIFFSVSSSKLPSYILPIFPALALLMARYLSHKQTFHATGTANTANTGIMPSAVLFLLLGLAGLALSPYITQVKHNPLETHLILAYRPWIIAASLLAIGAAVAALWLCQRKRPDHAMLSLAMASFGCWCLLLAGSETHGRYRSGLDLLPAINAELKPSTKLYAIGMYDQTLPFYLRRTMTQVVHMDELAFGLKQEPWLWIENLPAFVEEWQNGPPAIGMTSPQKLAELQTLGLRLRIITRDARRVIITNQMLPAAPGTKQP